MKDLARSISRVLKAADCKFVIIGAFARDLYFAQKNIKLEHATKDVDFAVLTEDWDQFEELKQKLIAELSLTPTEKVYRLKYGDVPVDFLPFGKITGDGDTIRWPGGFRERMSVMGFKEAYEHSVEIDIDGDKVRTIIPEMLLALKLISWSHGDRMKDALDIQLLLEHALQLFKGLPKEDIYFHLGARIRTMFENDKTLWYLENLMESNFNHFKLMKDMNKGDAPGEEMAKKMLPILKRLGEGIRK